MCRNQRQEGKDQRIILDQTIPMLPTMLPNMDKLTPIQSNSSESLSSHKSVQPPSYPSCPPNFPVTPSMTNNMSPNTKSIPTTKLPVVSHDGEMSPIHKSSVIKQQNPDNFVTDLNLDTPKLGKGALKKFNKFKGNFYLKSAPQERLDFYIKNSTDKISKTKVANFDELPAIPEEYFEGEPAWEIKEIKKAVENKDGWKYYVRYTGKHKDGWLTNDELKGSQWLITNFWDKRKSKTNSKKGKRSIEVPTRNPTKNIHEHVAARFKLGEGLRRSKRLSKSNLISEYANMSDTLFK